MNRWRHIRGWTAMAVVAAALTVGAAAAEPSKGVLEQANKFCERGAAFARDGSWARAKSEFQKALKVFPEHVDAIYNLAVCCEQLNLKDEAQEHYRRYTELAPNDADGWNQLGVLADSRGDRAEARRAYDRALQLNPSFGRAHHNLGVLLKEEGQWEAAEKHLEQFVSLEESAGRHTGEAYYSLGVLHLERLRVKEAKLLLQKALDADPQSALFNNAMGDVYLLEKEPQTALVYYDKAVAKDAKYALAYSGRGDAYKQLGEVDRAVENYRKAQELSPEYAVIDYKLGLLYQDANPGLAIKHLEKYLRSGKKLQFETEATARLAALKNPENNAQQ